MKIAAIIVTYNPDGSKVRASVQKLGKQVDQVVVVDNSDQPENIFADIQQVHYISMDGNKGIAAAQNKGIKYLQENNFDFVLFSDQDSESDETLIGELLRIYLYLEEQGISLAAIGPHPVRKDNGKSYYTVPRGKKIKENSIQVNNKNYTLVEMHSIMSSFSLCRVNSFSEIGEFESKLFIDAVDDEWCWRARSKFGKRSFFIKELLLRHMLGQETNLPINQSSPFRLYYQYRNFLILSRRDYTPIFWKFHCLWTYTLKLVFYPLFVKPRLLNLKQMLRGLKDGLYYKL